MHVDEILGLKIVGTIGISTYTELASCSISMVCETMHASHEATVAQWFGCQPVLQKILVRFHACMHAVFNILGSLKVSKNPFGFIPVLTCIMTTQSK